MTTNELYQNWQAFYKAGKGTFVDWYKSFGKANGVKIMPVTGLSFAGREAKEGGYPIDVNTAAQLTIKYGFTILPDTGDGVKEALGGLVSGFAAGGPVGAVVGFVGGAVSSNVKQKSVAEAVKNEVAGINTAAKAEPVVTPAQESVLSNAENLLNFKGKELWILSGLIILGFILFFVKK